MRRLLVAALAFAGCTVTLGAAHWASGATIHVWIDPLRAPAGGDQLVERAMSTWTTSANGLLKLERLGTRDGADIRVHFFTRDWRYGMTEARPDPRSGLLTSAEVIVAGDADGDDIDRQIVIYLTALHELGHALGLSHTADITHIMYLFREPGDGERFFGAYRRRLRSADDIGSARAPGLSSDDVKNLRALYDR
jgi:matrixin